MADRALHFAGAGAEVLGDAGVQFLRNAVDHIRLLDDQLDAVAQILIALDVRRDADGQEQAAQALVQALDVDGRGRGGGGQQAGAAVGQFANVVEQVLGLEGLDHVELRAQFDGAGDKVVAAQGAGDNDARAGHDLLAAQFLQQHVAVHHGHYNVGYQNVKTSFMQLLQGIHAVGCFAYLIYPFLTAQEICHAFAQGAMVIYNQNAGVCHADFPFLSGLVSAS